MGDGQSKGWWQHKIVYHYGSTENTVVFNRWATIPEPRKIYHPATAKAAEALETIMRDAGYHYINDINDGGVLGVNNFVHPNGYQRDVVIWPRASPSPARKKRERQAREKLKRQLDRQYEKQQEAEYQQHMLLQQHTLANTFHHPEASAPFVFDLYPTSDDQATGRYPDLHASDRH